MVLGLWSEVDAMKSFLKNRGIGFIEVLVAALILALTVTGTVVLLAGWGQTMGESQNRTSALVRLASVMDMGKHDSALLSDISTDFPETEAGTLSVASFEIVDVSVTSEINRDKFAASIQWANPYESSEGATSKFGLHSYSPKRSGFMAVSTPTTGGCVSNCGGNDDSDSSTSKSKSSKSKSSKSKSSKSKSQGSCVGGSSSNSGSGSCGGSESSKSKSSKSKSSKSKSSKSKSSKSKSSKSKSSKKNKKNKKNKKK